MRKAPICDFCSETPVVASFPAKDFSMMIPLPNGQVTKQNSWGAWAACQSCYDFIEGKDVEGLARRATDHLMARAPEMRQAFSDYAAVTLHKERFEKFMEARMGAPVPASEVDWEAIPDYNVLTAPDGREYRVRQIDEVPDLLGHPDAIKLVRNRARSGHEWLEFRDFLAECLRQHPYEIGALACWEFTNNLGPLWPLTPRIMDGMAHCLTDAAITVWETDQWETATSGHAAFVNTPVSVEGLPANALWVFADDLILDAETQKNLGLDVECALSAVLITSVRAEGRKGYGMTWFLAPALPESWWTKDMVDGKGFRPEVALPRLRSLPETWEGEGTVTAYSAVEAARAFLDLPLVSTAPARTSRQVTRQYERKKPKHNATVEQVVLRRLVRPHHEPVASEGREVDWNCQWWVSGHWRRRSERWTKGKGNIWVTPHVKGPPEKPLRPTKERIIRVRR